MLKSLFEHNDYMVCVADNGIVAETVVMKEQYDAAIIDLRMPVIDGIETFRRIKAISPNIPVVMMSATPCKVSRKEAHKLGAIAFFEKPSDFEPLLKTISKFLS
jgi:DNA-binding response OmpR family regulator